MSDDPNSSPGPGAPLRLFNSLTRQLEEFHPVHPGVPGDPAQPPEARVYSCGPTVYNFQHIGNMRAYIFADILGRTLSWKGYDLTHVINITDVGHLTSDADAGDDKMEKAAQKTGKSAWDIAAFYQADFETDLARLNVRRPAHPRATEYVPAMIEFAKSIEAHCYELPGGLYFDTSTVAKYGALARAVSDEGESRIDPVEGKRHVADFAIWRKTPPGETRQMEWDSPWGKGAPGWHLECSVMSGQLLGFPFDIHTGGIDHREIHHPNEIAQNQAFCGSDKSGANIWMHNNFLVERSGKMSKSAGEFLRLQLLIDRGHHPLAYRLMCLQAHYRSELEFSWKGLGAAFVRLKRLNLAVKNAQMRMYLKAPDGKPIPDNEVVLDAQVAKYLEAFDVAICADLNTAASLVILDELLANKGFDPRQVVRVAHRMNDVLGLELFSGSAGRVLRIRPKDSSITEPEIEAILARRKEARAARDFATSDELRDELGALGVEVMDGDPLGWDWKLG